MNKRKIVKYIFAVIAILFGIFMFVYGGYDDSPGGQLLGVIIFITGIVGIVKNRKKLPTKTSSDVENLSE